MNRESCRHKLRVQKFRFSKSLLGLVGKRDGFYLIEDSFRLYCPNFHRVFMNLWRLEQEPHAVEAANASPPEASSASRFELQTLWARTFLVTSSLWLAAGYLWFCLFAFPVAVHCLCRTLRVASKETTSILSNKKTRETRTDSFFNLFLLFERFQIRLLSVILASTGLALVPTAFVRLEQSLQISTNIETSHDDHRSSQQYYDTGQ